MKTKPEIIPVNDIVELQKKVNEYDTEVAIYSGIVSLDDKAKSIPQSKLREFLTNMGLLDPKIAKPPYQVLEDGFMEPIGDIIDLGKNHRNDYESLLKKPLPNDLAHAYLVMKPSKNNGIEKIIGNYVGSAVTMKEFKKNILDLYILTKK